MDNWKIFIISSGFYFFGNEVQASDGYIALDKCSMFAGFSGGKGMPGVAGGAKGATVILDRFPPADVQTFPISACLGVINAVNLYEFTGTTLR